MSAAAVFVLERMAYKYQMIRVDAILLSRKGLIPSQAIDAYLKLEPALSIGPAKDDNERKCNSKSGLSRSSSSAGPNAPIVVTDGKKART